MHLYPYNLGLFFSQIASRYASHNAIYNIDDTVITYSDLEVLSNQIAHKFILLGIKRHDVIAIANGKTHWGFASMLAALKLGVIYVNIDDQNPPERILKILDKSNTRLVATDLSLSINLIKLLNHNKIDILDLIGSENMMPYTPIFEQMKEVSSADPAYLMFTSGSTGTPKGAVISHGSVINFINWSVCNFQFGPGEILTNVNPIYFDNSVFDFYSSLFSGAALVPFTREMVKNPGILVKRVELLECSTWFSVPSLLIYLSTMRQLSSYRWPSIKRIIFGGESYPISELKKLWKFFGNRATLVNVYGPTECTCICTQYIITEKDISALKGIPPLGQLIPNFSHIIVNENSERVNIGENGELLLIGPQVGLGYFNDIDRTKDAFINNPLNLNYNEITYRTGDLVKIDGQGILWFVGRKDNQIKHLGYRIELEEIESAIYSLPYIVEAIAIHHKNDHKSYLGAFISVRVKISEDAVINDLKTLLPTYMLPEIIKILEYLPKNSNGKLDRKILKSSFVNICEIY